jgi:hypothetical protein
MPTLHIGRGMRGPFWCCQMLTHLREVRPRSQEITNTISCPVRLAQEVTSRSKAQGDVKHKDLS